MQFIMNFQLPASVHCSRITLLCTFKGRAGPGRAVVWVSGTNTLKPFLLQEGGILTYNIIGYDLMGWCSGGRAVAADTRDPLFKCNFGNFFNSQPDGKKRSGIAHFKTYFDLTLLIASPHDMANIWQELTQLFRANC